MTQSQSTPLPSPLRVVVWNEFLHERQNDEVRALYPDGIHAVIADGLQKRLGNAAELHTAILDDPDHGLSQERIDSTDVLFWWGHMAHERVSDEVVDRVHRAVLEGMGLIVLHSGHGAKIFQRLMGTGCMLRWREDGKPEKLWVVAPGHEIVEGLDADHFELPRAEMYGEFFDIPAPDELIFISSFAGGEVFRSGCTWRRGKGRIFYFRPGHETYPIYYDERVQHILANAVRWARPRGVPYHFEARECR